MYQCPCCEFLISNKTKEQAQVDFECPRCRMASFSDFIYYLMEKDRIKEEEETDDNDS